MPMSGRKRSLVVLSVLVLVATALPVVPALAYKPYTHAHTAEQARADAADGWVTINGREYQVPPAVAAAVRDWPQYYKAGVVGPDGFPDLTFGQAVIHPEETGTWLAYVLDRAWQAQSDPRYSAAERSQILAFAYGFLTHAAGDLWAHTVVNDFSVGIFPAVGEILSDVDKAEIALRHIIIEGYIGDATPGFDGNPNRDWAPGTNQDGDPDRSDDSSPAIPFSAPRDFIYNILVDPNVPLPVGTCGDGVDDDGDGVADDGCPGQSFTVGDPEPQRGPIIDFFLDLQADLQIEERKVHEDGAHLDCALIDPDCYEVTHSFTVSTVRGLRSASITRQECIGALIGCLPSVVDAADDLIFNSIVEAYLEAWIDDIVDGLRAWPEVGLATTRALFDPQTYRDAQNEICRNKGDEFNPLRINCENGVGATDVLLFALDDFINDHLLSMIGAPDFVGDLRDFFGDAFDFVEDLIAAILPPELNFIALAGEAIKEAIGELVQSAIEEVLGLDLDQLKSFMKSPTHWLNVQQATLELPLLGPVSVDFFQPGDHARLDGYLGLGPSHHVTGDVELPDGSIVTSSRLSDTAVYDPNNFAVAKNSVTIYKALLLNGAELNRLLGDELVALGLIADPTLVQTYSDGTTPANIMVNALAGGDPWLRSIDSDHSWRADGRPVFPTRPVGVEHGGRGNFPVWESCLLRPAFRSLFTDWENPGDNFPDLGDDPAPDPSDPDAPVMNPAVAGGNTYTAGDGTVYLGGDNPITISGSDAVFLDGGLEVQYRVYMEGTAPGAWQPIANGGSFNVPAGAGDGVWIVESRAGDPCHAVETVTPREDRFVLDTTPPQITITSPADGAVFDTDDFSSIDWTVTDGALGSGVAAESATFDGAPAANGQVLDMFLLDPGAHVVEVIASDNLGNTATVAHTFEVHATSESLLNNVDRAFAEGLITDPDVYQGLRDKTVAALKKHNQGKHATEHNILGAFINQLEAQRDKGVEAATADRFISYAEDLIAGGG